ncbi:hypothetical protein Bca52824_013129 [Brassica carinata]|uniref:Uncharacterized protein n=1 Tax=Brassica carinata TaxID=52824 RepID=A0A8X7VYU1_BRACI|nr:hypothetical protein Bca52824_013129 [Brassica carinata]
MPQRRRRLWYVFSLTRNLYLNSTQATKFNFDTTISAIEEFTSRVIYNYTHVQLCFRLPAATKLQTWMPNLYYQHLQLHVHAPRRARKVDEANLPSFENEEKSRKRPRE